MKTRQIIADLHRRARRKAIEDADEVEWQAVKEGFSIIEYGIADEQISGSLVDESELVDDEELDPSLGQPAWGLRAEAEEQTAGETAEEIQRRALVLGTHYPFKVAGNRIEHIQSPDGLYEFLLAVSVSNDLVSTPFNQLPQAFEALSTEILKSWMGPGSKGWQIGFPGRMAAGLPKSLPELWRLIHEETGEWEWQPDAEVPDDAADDQKDLGMDVLVWKSVLDSRTHSLFLAGQCACGRDALSGTGKSADLSHKWLDVWFRTKSRLDFVPCLLIPRCLGSSTTEVRARTGTLYFDRIRLMLAARQSARPIQSAAARKTAKKYADLVDMVKASS